jgi:hypothetical protein
MRVKKWVEVEAEVEVNISGEDVARMLGIELPDRVKTVMMGMNNIACFMKAIPDAVIAEMSAENRAIIKKFLSEQVVRYSDEV